MLKVKTAVEKLKHESFKLFISTLTFELLALNYFLIYGSSPKNLARLIASDNRR